MAGLYIKLEREIPEFDSYVAGKALSKANPDILTPLMEFFSVGQDEIDFAAGEGVEVEIPEQKWFSAKDGLAVVRATAAKIRAADSNDKTAKMLLDLHDFERVLTEAEEKGIAWCLGIDY